jgi:hypothetical protein
MSSHQSGEMMHPLRGQTRIGVDGMEQLLKGVLNTALKADCQPHQSSM